MRFLPSLLCALALLGLPHPSIGTAAPLPKKLTLAQALTAAPPPADGLVLTVSAETVTLPDGTASPPAGTSLADITSAFGDKTVSFGSITAIAPATMVLLNAQPDAPDIASDLSGAPVLSMLMASLDEAQWQALISKHGLGLPDLTDDLQRGLFHALFDHGQLWVGSEDPALSDLPQEQRSDVRDLSDQIDGIQIRLVQTAHIYLHDREDKTIYFSEDRPGTAQRLHTYRPKTLPPSAEHGVMLRDAVPNALKPSNLDLDGKVLQASVPTAGLKTVGDLVTRIGLRTGLELYADPHYAAKTLTIAGTAANVPAADLLRAVSLCVTGTFRKVGPAYVLTDDLIGVGIQRQHLVAWEQAANRAGNELEEHAAQINLDRHAADVRKLQAFGDPLGLTTEELAALADDPFLSPLPTMSTTVYPFAQLSSAQQAWMRQQAEAYQEKRQSGTLSPDGSDEAPRDPDLTHNVSLRMNVQMQIVLPTENTVVDTNMSSLQISLFWPDITSLLSKARVVDAEAKAKALAKLPPAPPLSAMLHFGRRRAVLAHPRTAKDVDALVASMQKLGLNALFLDVFSGGVNHVKTSAVSGSDILTEALTRTRGTGIAVYADLSLLSWGDAPPESMRDLTIDGQTNREAAVDADKNNPYGNYDDDDNLIPFVAPPIRVSPAAPAVSATLAELVRSLSAQPGLAGLVLEDADPDGELGYTPEMRLAFLRAAHGDPIDMTQGNYLRADDTLPLFDDDALDKSLLEQWAKAQTESYIFLLGQLRAAAQRGDGTLVPILTEQASLTDRWYISWDNPSQTPTSLREQQADGIYVPQEKITQIARTPGRSVLRRETIQNDGDTVTLARKLQDDAKTLPGASFVLDFTHESVTQGAAPLDSLVGAVFGGENGKIECENLSSAPFGVRPAPLPDFPCRSARRGRSGADADSASAAPQECRRDSCGAEG